MKSLRNPHGQGLLETILCLPVVIAFITMIMILSYRAVIFYYADMMLHEALICTDDSSISACEKELSTKMHKVLITNESFEVRLKSQGKIIQGKVLIQNKWPLLIEKRMQFPLKAPRKWI